MPSPAPRIGLLGCGLWGSNILRELRGLGAQVLVVDVDESARTRALNEGAVVAVGKPSDLAAVDGWIVATPATLHRPSIAEIAASARPILCEKPLAASLADAHAIAGSVRGPVHVVDVWRYHPAVHLLRELANGGSLGAVRGLRSTRANWTSPRTDVDSAWNLLPHDISIYREVFGVLPEPGAALAELEDGQVRSLWTQWRSNPWMVSEASNRFASRRRELQLHCARGVAFWSEAQAGQVVVHSGAANDRLEAVDRLAHPLSSTSALRGQLSHWLGFLAGGDAPRTDLAHAIEAIGLVERVRALAGLPA